MEIIYCPVCNARLFDSLDKSGRLIIKCRRCKVLLQYDGKTNEIKKIDGTYRAVETK